jgi:hypothetical protein
MKRLTISPITSDAQIISDIQYVIINQTVYSPVLGEGLIIDNVNENDVSFINSIINILKTSYSIDITIESEDI